MNPEEEAGVIKAVIDNSLIELNVCIPCVVEAVNGNRVNVRPAINRNRVQPDGTRLTEITEIIEEVPIVFMSSANGFVRIPIEVGDKGLLIFCDYDIDEWFVNDNPDPNTARVHDLNDPFFFPSFTATDEAYAHDCTEIGYQGNTLRICEDQITANVDIVVNGISFLEHTHGGVKRGGSFTDPPN